ncbi:MAG TPA: rhodanese-like domain-containing protein [Crocinitomix sp.]|nr:rhodanese-like domain-containing protein [Crocinitomix sp.]
MEVINATTLQKMLANGEDVQVIDVRTPEEVAEGKIPNAVNMNVFDPNFVNQIQDLDKSKPYVMVCRSGARSGQACMHMLGAGFEKVYNLQGGMMMWTGEIV